MNSSTSSRPIPLRNIHIDDPFWTPKLELVRSTVIPYQYDALNDRIPGAEKSYAIANFCKAAAVLAARAAGDSVPTYPVDKWCYGDDAPDDAFHGWVFQDSDVYKWIEAASYSLVNHYDASLHDRVRRTIDLVCSAQMDNGYLDTLYIINDPDLVFTNLRDFHELYCFGHLAEAAVAYYDATGEHKLLDATLRFADLLCDTFGPDGKRGYPGHEIAELALVKLYRTTDDERYLHLAEFFINERGTRPYYYDAEHGTHTAGEGYHYNQAHRPPRHQHDAVGHAVRGVYLYSGMADVAALTGDEELYAACRDIWHNISSKKLYITGGIGATVDGEAFSFDYDLPNDLAYCETCATIGLEMFGARMTSIGADARYGDVMERGLYNTIPASMSSSGTEFFYVNPLEVLPPASRHDSRKRHIKPVRQKWFGCACCPPNLARFLSSIGTYCFGENDDTIFIHQYIGADVQSALGNLHIASQYSTAGTVNISLSPARPCTLALRIPSWSRDVHIPAAHTVRDGYAYINVSGDICMDIDFGIAPRYVACSGNVRANVGRVAVAYGPTVYCAEGVDNGDSLHLLSVDPSAALQYDDGCITASGYRTTPHTELYYDYRPDDMVAAQIHLVPYHTWGNRGENEMTVYLPVAKKL